MSALIIRVLQEPHRTDFFATGDLAYVDKCQELHVVGRKSVYLESRGFA